MVKVITAPEKIEFPKDCVKVFLAGGIQKCDEWQQKVIDLFKTNGESKNVYLMNPRRENFPIDDPNASYEQIKWEFDMLEQCDLFTMLFLNSESDQPICFYELGRNIERMKERFPQSWDKRIVVTCDINFKRKQDVEIQTKLATDGYVGVNTCSTDILIKQHFSEILKTIYKGWE